jgi:ribosomal protein L29
MKISELHQKSKDELQKNLEEEREKLRQLRFDLSAGKIKNVREVQKVKKEIAQILTLLKQK